MQNTIGSAYLKYRRLLLLLLIFPSFKLVQALIQNDLLSAFIMGVIICIAIGSLGILEWQNRSNMGLKKKMT